MENTYSDPEVSGYSGPFSCRGGNRRGIYQAFLAKTEQGALHNTMSLILNEQLTEVTRESSENAVSKTSKCDYDKNLIFGAYFSIKINSLTRRNLFSLVLICVLL